MEGVNSADYLQFVSPNQAVQSVNEQQIFIHSGPQGENQPVQYDFQNNQQLQLFQLSESTQQQLIHMPDGQIFVYQPIQIDRTPVIVQPHQEDPIFTNINVNISQIYRTLSSKMPIVVTQSATTTTTTTIVTATTTATATITVKEELKVMVPNIITDGNKQFQQLPTTQKLDEKEPIYYVNPKQYHRIMIRRQARAKLVAERNIPITRKKHFYKSRHKKTLNQIQRDNGCYNSDSS